MHHTNPAVAWALWVSEGSIFDYSVGEAFAVGSAIGLGAALVEMARLGRSDRSGVQAARRLVGNILWLGSYILLVDASFTLLLMGVFTVAFPGPSSLRELLPNIFILNSFGANVLAIAWATARTAAKDDVLSPRVLWGKWRSSTRALE